jgi:hypothetical protein
MTIYNVTYYRHDKNITETKQVQAESMRVAVKRLVDTANHHNAKVSQISCMVSNSRGVQRFCDTCLLNEASYGFKDKIIKCKECKE